MASKLFCENLRFLRQQHKLSQDALARTLQLNRGNIASYEKGTAEPNMHNLLKIMRYFNVELGDLLETDLSKAEQIGHELQNLASGPANASLPGTEETKVFVLRELQQQSERIGYFLKQSNEMQKILDGFRHFYHYKRNSKKELWRDVDKMIADYEDLLEIMEVLQGTNREITDYLQQSSDSRQA